MFYKLYEFLNRLFKLSFQNTNFEKRFQQTHLEDNLYQNIIAVKIAFIAYIIYYFVAYYMTPEDFLFNAFFILPIPIILSLLFLYLTDTKTVGQNHLLKLFIFAIGIGFPAILNIATSEIYQQLYVTNTMLPIFAVFVMYGAPFSIALLSVASLILFFFFTLFVSGLEAGIVIHSLFLILTTFIISATSGYLMEKSKRKNYLAIFVQEELNAKLKQEQEKNIKKEKLLQQQARLAQMGEMLSMIAHQWRQPLGAISAAVFSIETKKASGKFNLEIKEDRDKLSEFSDKKLENINEYVQVLSNTVDDFRNFFKPDKEKESVCLTTPLLRALKIVESSMSSRNIIISTKFDCDDEVLMYQNEVMQVILNILKNAEDNFNEKNIQNPKLEIYTKKQEEVYFLSISDNGGGIADNILPNIFNPYFSTKDEKNGTGLGLYMSKIMIEEHNDGELSVFNTQDGVCFEIILDRNENVKITV